MRIRTFLLAGVSVGALIQPSNAADLPLKAAPAARVFGWNGFYAGLFVGAGFDQSDNSATMQRFTGAAPPHPLQSGELPNSSDAFPFGGVTLGYNQQYGQYLLGVETDFAASAAVGRGPLGLAEGPITYTVSGESGYRWFGTLRARGGYLVGPDTLAYVTGGLAYADLRQSFRQTAVGPGPVGTFNFGSDGSGWRAGWVVGAGIEHRLDGHWSVKAEYQYLNFDHDFSSTTAIQFTPGGKGNRGVFTASSTDANAHTVRVGLNYRFWTP